MTDAWIKDPDATLDWEFDWTNWLSTSDGEVIVSHVITVQTGLTKVSDSATTETVTVWLSGGSVRNVYNVTCHITTSAGRQDDRTLGLTIADR